VLLLTDIPRACSNIFSILSTCDRNSSSLLLGLASLPSLRLPVACFLPVPRLASLSHLANFSGYWCLSAASLALLVSSSLSLFLVELLCACCASLCLLAPLCPDFCSALQQSRSSFSIRDRPLPVLALAMAIAPLGRYDSART
jgi:hypothetical protein